MNTADWWKIVNNNWPQLQILMLKYHPTLAGPSNLRITAERAEKACEFVRQQIKDSSLPVTAEGLNTLRENYDWPHLYAVLNQTWFGIPESVVAWQLPGFSVLCTLLEDPPENEEPEEDDYVPIV